MTMLSTALLSSLALVQQTPTIATPETQLFPQGLATNTAFGLGMELEGDRLAVSAQNEGAGAVYVFERSGTTWSLDERLSDVPGIDDLGVRIVLDGDRLIAGTRSNVAVLYERTSTGWGTPTVLSGSDTVAGDEFGRSAAIDGDWIAVGAPSVPLSIFGPVGAIYMFERSGTQWVERQKIMPTNVPSDSLFGAGILMDGDRFVTGTFGPTSLTPRTLYVYERSGTEWVEQDRITQPTGDIQFTLNSIRGDLISARSLSFGSFPESDVIYLYRNSATGWNLEATLRSHDVLNSGAGIFLNGSRLLPGERLAVWQSFPSRLHLFEKQGEEWKQTGVSFPSDSTERWGQVFAIDGSTVVTNDPTTSDAFVQVLSLAPSEHLAFCSGNGTGCTPCPCANDGHPALLGGCTNGQSASATLIASGSASASSDTLRMDVTGALANSFALLISAVDPLPLMGACPPGSGIAPPVFDGLRCVGNGLIRHGTRSIDAFGRNVQPWGGPGAPTQGLLARANLDIGDTKYFQVFYRDDASQGCGTGANTSNAVEVTVTP